ncbi:O-antigen ligase family protein [Flaviaesturariibacter flavus]|uniref:O-antigen ligase family protein n=1 Tax=Flaviaesturariibacter flavus TaxID=2502780 RepID=A0A4R1BP75_9BACT|nr:O-antigen ligase family protein [Flaviaesturariibacter flavus]TCJ19321.1 O-antigen ligase family protein [Flaviaesturariibacter flavus]
MNLITSKPARFLLGPLQLLLFILPFSAIFLAIPALAPLDAVLNLLGTVCIALSVAYIFFADDICVSLEGSIPLFAVLAFYALSISWSPVELRSNSVHDTVRMLLTVLQAFVVVNVLGREALFRTLKHIAIFVVVLNLGFIFAFPAQASWYFEDATRTQGLFSSPNNMGQFLAFAFIVINLFEPRSLPWLVLLALDAAIVYQLLRCDSMTSLGGVIVIFIAYRIRFLMRPLFYVVIGLGLLVPFLSQIMGSTDMPLGINNRDLTFTGRTDVWEIIRSDLAAQDRVATGFGSGGYWLSKEEYNPFSHIHELSWDPGQGHNGYMDVLVNTGVVGLVFVLLFLFAMIGSIFRRVPWSEPVAYFLPLIVLFNNITEASLFREKHLYFVLLLLVFWYLFLEPAEAAEPEAEPDGTLLAQPN